MTDQTTIMIEQYEYEYYAYTPEWEGSDMQSDSLDEVLPDIWEAVALYLETISEETFGY
jgi:predicted RNase H-like HicB family nuclease